jgi:excisionase family DNA binding protein
VIDETRVYTVPEAAKLLRIGVRTYYEAARRGEVPVVRIGRREVVPGAALLRFLSGEAIASDGHPSPK